MLLLAGAVGILILSAAPDPTTRLRLAAPGFGLVNVDEKLGSFLVEHVAQQLKLAQIDVVTAKEMQSLLGLERQKALLGCNEPGSCMAELASALGADGMVLGDIAKVGSRYQLNLKIIGARAGETLAVFAENVASEEEVIDALTRGAHLLAVDLNHRLGRPPPPEVGASGGARKLAWAPLVLGVVAVAGGAISFGVSQGAYDKLKKDPVVLDGRPRWPPGAPPRASPWRASWWVASLSPARRRSSFWEHHRR